MKYAISAAVITLALLVAGAPVTAAPRAHTAAKSISVKASEFKFALSPGSGSRGTVTFKIKNVGHLPHDFKIAGKKSKLIKPGASTTLKVTLKKGKIAYRCTVAGHAKAGMKGKLTVR
jgi:uncharacterized cupredoxin-like copper-binding protein